MKITGNTTVAELAVLRARFGVVGIRLAYSHEALALVVAIVYTEHSTHHGSGDTEAQALDDAFARLEQVVAERLLETP
jgi:hypothetical protein